MSRRLAPIALTALLIAGCSGGGDGAAPEPTAAESTPAPTVEATQEPEPTPEPADGTWEEFALAMKFAIMDSVSSFEESGFECGVSYGTDACADVWAQFNYDMEFYAKRWSEFDAAITPTDAELMPGVDEAFAQYAALVRVRDASCDVDSEAKRCLLDAAELPVQAIEIAQLLHLWEDPDFTP